MMLTLGLILVILSHGDDHDKDDDDKHDDGKDNDTRI